MATQKGTSKDMTWVNVKMRSWVLDLLRENKEEKDTPIVKFVERAVLEKLGHHAAAKTKKGNK